MRRIIAAALIALGAVSAAAAPAFADEGPKPAQISVWCSADDRTAHDDLQGIVLLPDGSHGDVELRLFADGNPGKGEGDSGWHGTGETTHIQTVRGQTAYTFHFDISSSHFASYRIEGPGDVKSRIIGRDECAFRGPEVPASSLLIVAGVLPIAAWVSIRRYGVPARIFGRRIH